MDPLIGRVVLERYEVLKRLGSGGMGAVYAARQIAVGRDVALKILRADLVNNESVRERFRREAEIIGKLRHPNTIQLIDYGETPDGLAVIVMELLVGLALSDRLKQLGPMAAPDAIRCGMQIAQSLAEAHAAGLVHRDLKPANIFLVEVAGQTHAKVLDFGIARIVDEEATRLTADGQVFGTPRYMSPEQGMATGEVDARTDLYSLGLIVFECLVGQPPFVAQTSIQYLSAHATLPPPKLSDHLPNALPSLEQLIDACLVKERGDRIQTADAVAEGLRRITHELESGSDAATNIPGAATNLDASGVADTSSSIADLLPARPPTEAPPIAAPPTAAPPSIAPGPPTEGLVPPRSSNLATAGAIAAVLAGLIMIAVFVLGPKDGDGPTPSNDATVVVAEPEPEVEPEPVPEVKVEALDIPEPEPEPEVEAPPKVVKKRPKPKPKKRKPEGDPTLPGAGGITGPRGLNIAVDEIDEATLLAAQACTASRLPPGDAKLVVSGCKSGCAVLLDGDCAGRTPIAGVDTARGNKSVSVVCGDQVAAESVVRLRSGKTSTVRCD